MKPNARTLVRLLVALAATAAALPAAAQTSLRCDPGFALESTGTGARCRRPPIVQRMALASCAPHFEVRTDALWDGQDQCVRHNPWTGTVAVRRTCPVGYNYRLRAGADICELGWSEEVRSPTQVDR